MDNLEKKLSTENIIRALEKEVPDVESISGETELSRLIRTFKRSSIDTTLSVKFEMNVLRVFDNVMKSDKIKFKRYCDLILLLFQGHQNIAIDLKKKFNRSTNIGLDKKAELLRLISKLGFSFTRRVLDKEKEIKDQYPWHWIDSAYTSNWHGVVDFISALASQKDFQIDELLIRLSNWRQRLNSPIFDSAITQWGSAMNEHHRKMLNDWLERRGYISEYIIESDSSGQIFGANFHPVGETILEDII